MLYYKGKHKGEGDKGGWLPPRGFEWFQPPPPSLRWNPVFALESKQYTGFVYTLYTYAKINN